MQLGRPLRARVLASIRIRARQHASLCVRVRANVLATVQCVRDFVYLLRTCTSLTDP